MKTHRLSRFLSATFALALLLGAAPAAAKENKKPSGAAHHHGAADERAGHAGHGADHGGHESLPAGKAVSGASLYALNRSFLDAKGKELQLASLRGKPVLISMFYATCPHACPLLISDIKRIERQLPEALRQQVQVVLVTLDPDRDSPESMAKLLAAHEVDAKRWQALHTSAETVRELAGLLGIKYRFTADGGINHSSVITLLDEEGMIRERVEGLRQPGDRILRVLQEKR